MNVSQALEYERQPFIPMFIYGDHGAMESERQKGEEALKVLETEYFTAEGDPSFDFATVRDLADRNRDLCDQIGEARLRNVTPATLSRGLSDADTCAAIGKMQKRTAASVMREIRGDRDALGVAYARSGEVRKAEEAFRRAVGQGSDEARHNLEQLRLVIDQL